MSIAVSLYRAQQLIHILITPRRIHLQTPLNHRCQRTLRLLLLRHLPRQHFIQQHAQRINIRRWLRGGKPILLRRRIPESSDQYRIAGTLILSRFRGIEIHQHQLIHRRNQNVARLDIPMNYRRVQLMQRTQNRAQLLKIR